MLTRRQCIATTLAALSTRNGFGAVTGSHSDAMEPRPLILDTDIGDDIDDTWALLLLLRQSSIDLRLAVGDFGNPLYRARLLGRLLERFGFSDLPIGVGLTLNDGTVDERGQQSSWLGDYRLEQYPGPVHVDGVQAIIDTINASPRPVILLCLGPVPNIAEALRRDPKIADNAEFVGMHGSVHRGYGGDPTPVAEYNVRVDPSSLQAVFRASWNCTITPLDTCGDIVLRGSNYQRLVNNDAPDIRVLMENYKAWLPGAPFIAPNHDVNLTSTTLFDAVAVHLALGGDLVNMQELPLRVTDDGFTVIDLEGGRPVNCALTWRDQALFEKRLVDMLLA